MKPMPNADEHRRLGDIDEAEADKLPPGKDRDRLRRKARDHESEAHSPIGAAPTCINPIELAAQQGSRHGRAVGVRFSEQVPRVLIEAVRGCAMMSRNLKGNHVQIHPEQDQDTENDYPEEEATHHLRQPSCAAIHFQAL